MQVELLMYLMTELEVQGKQQEGKKSELRKKSNFVELRNTLS
jgi:hypothetical protein